jgi:hypothetical protein
MFDELPAEELLELAPPPDELAEVLFELLLPPQAASPIEEIARSPGTSTPSNLDLDPIVLPFI